MKEKLSIVLSSLLKVKKKTITTCQFKSKKRQLTYSVLEPPFPMIPFKEMKKKQADQYLSWFLETKELRILNLQKYISLDSTIILDHTVDSINLLWSWFFKKVEQVPREKCEIEVEVRLHPRLRQEIEQITTKLSDSTKILAYDISVYLGSVIIENYPGVYWGYLSKPKALVGVNEPRLLGFKSKEQIYLYNTVIVDILRSLNEYNENAFYETYMMCMNF